jgi:hypothetical protein
LSLSFHFKLSSLSSSWKERSLLQLQDWLINKKESRKTVDSREIFIFEYQLCSDLIIVCW